MPPERPLLEVVRHPLRMRLLEVVTVERPTPRLVRVALAGDDLAGFCSLGASDHVKVFFPEPGGRVAAVPELGPRGILPTSGRPVARGRDYTPKHHRLREGVLELDVVLHAGGVGAAWAERAEPGHVLGVAGPRGSHVLADDVEGLVLVGDETALPAIQNFAFHAPPELPLVAIVEVDDERDVQPLAVEGRRGATWVFRRGAPAGTTTGLLDALAAARLPPGRALHWVAGEAGVVRAARAHLVGRGLPDQRIDARGYWKLGAADHQEPHED